ARRCVGNGDMIESAASLHAADADGAAIGQAHECIAEKLQIADAVEIVIVGDPGGAIAEPDLGAQIEADLAAAIGRRAAKGAPDPPFIEQERPFDLAPNGM